MNVPDYVSPIIGYRAWHWEAGGLKSLNGTLWPATQPLKAECQGMLNGHQAPYAGCSCGIYGAKGLDNLREMGYGRLGIYGEVYLWGTVVEHAFGWRAQFAYPKTLVVPRSSLLPHQPAEHALTLLYDVFARRLNQSNPARCVWALTAYGADIFLGDREENLIPVWTKGSGYTLTGLNRWSKGPTQPAGFLVPIAVLTEDPERRIILEKRVQQTDMVQVVYSQVGLPTNTPDAIVYQVRDQRPEVVIVDLGPRNPRPGIRAIGIIRAMLPDIAIVAVGSTRHPDTIVAAMRAGADEHADRNNKHRFAEALARILVIVRARSSGARPRGASPPTGGLAPPPAVPVLSHRIWPRIPFPWVQPGGI